ncbi:MAG: resolvase [Cyanobium sp. CACIAM 14]|nr:MAG: resolvase [Cyanobium sp. CACIAM 14]
MLVHPAQAGSAATGPLASQAPAPAGQTPIATLPAHPPGPFQAASGSEEPLIGIDEVQRSLNRSRASVYRYTNTDPRNLNPPFNPRKLNPEYRSDQKDPLMFHPHEVARFARDVLRIKEVTVEVLNSPSTATQQLLASILEELKAIRAHLERAEPSTGTLDLHRHPHAQSRPAA